MTGRGRTARGTWTRGRRRHWVALAVAALIAPAGACDESTEVTPANGGGGTTSTGGAGGTTTTSTTTNSGGDGGTAMPTIQFSGTAVRSPQGTPITGVEVCIFDVPELPCASTDSQGSFSTAAPANAETGLTLTHASYADILVPIVTSDQDQDGWIIGVPPLPDVVGYYTSAGGAYPDPGKGFLAAYAMDGNSQAGLPGIEVALVPSSGLGPLYANAGGSYDAQLQATTTGGLARFGGVDLGEVEVVLSGGPSCDSVFGGWPTTTLNAVRVPIADGLETRVAFACF